MMVTVSSTSVTGRGHDGHARSVQHPSQHVVTMVTVS